jgi:hypothetical protein
VFQAPRQRFSGSLKTSFSQPGVSASPESLCSGGVLAVLMAKVRLKPLPTCDPQPWSMFSARR